MFQIELRRFSYKLLSKGLKEQKLSSKSMRSEMPFIVQLRFYHELICGCDRVDSRVETSDLKPQKLIQAFHFSQTHTWSYLCFSDSSATVFILLAMFGLWKQ